MITTQHVLVLAQHKIVGVITTQSQLVVVLTQQIIVVAPKLVVCHLNLWLKLVETQLNRTKIAAAPTILGQFSLKML